HVAEQPGERDEVAHSGLAERAGALGNRRCGLPAIAGRLRTRVRDEQRDNGASRKSDDTNGQPALVHAATSLCSERGSSLTDAAYAPVPTPCRESRRGLRRCP